jgi:hypothetical protein
MLAYIGMVLQQMFHINHWQGEKEKIFEFGYLSDTIPSLFLIREILGFTDISIKETGEETEGICFEIIIPRDKYRSIK